MIDAFGLIAGQLRRLVAVYSGTADAWVAFAGVADVFCGAAQFTGRTWCEWVSRDQDRVVVCAGAAVAGDTYLSEVSANT